jgi:GT2 family glycosyltransferase
MPVRLNSNPQVVCIVLNWNGWQDTIECLGALKQCTYPHLSVIVVDNGSTNDSVARIRAAHADILLLESGTNLGFAGGNNIGIRYALARGADYVWLLNNDTKPATDALSALVAKALTDRRIGAVASICYYADAPSLVEAWAGTRVNLWIGYVRNSTEPHEDDWFEALYGASLLIARAAIEDAGLLDEGFFLYWEETEFCLRLRKEGWRLAAAPDSRVLHKVNASTGGNTVILDRYFTASGLRLLGLHSPAPRLASFLFLAVRFTRRLVRLQFARCRSVWAGARDFYDAASAPSKRTNAR